MVKHYSDMYMETLGQNTELFSTKLNELYKTQDTRIIENLRQEYQGLDPVEFKDKNIEDILDVENDTKEYEELLKSMGIEVGGNIGPLALMLTGGFPKEKAVGDPRKVPDSQIVGEVDLNTEAYEKFIESRSQYFKQRTNAKVREDLFNEIRIANNKDDSLTEIEARVTEALGKRRIVEESFRTDTVARTEMSAFQNFVNVEAYKQSGITMHRWELDPKTPTLDQDCLEASKTVVPIGKDFNNGVKFPPVHPNCDCFTVPVKETKAVTE
jgi:hypothetical protein